MSEPAIEPRREATAAESAALASAIRLRIIRLTFHRALTNKEIAEELDKDPATTLHHIRKLVDTGFLVAQPVRRGRRGSREIPYLSTGLSWQLSNPPGDEAAVGKAMFEAYLGEVADVGIAGLDQTRLILQLDEARRDELQDRLADLLQEFASTPPEPDGERIAVYLALYPGT